jgi:hypothetical protein
MLSGGPAATSPPKKLASRMLFGREVRCRTPEPLMSQMGPPGDMLRLNCNVRFAPDNGLGSEQSRCQLRAIRRHRSENDHAYQANDPASLKPRNRLCREVALRAGLYSTGGIVRTHATIASISSSFILAKRVPIGDLSCVPSGRTP